MQSLFGRMPLLLGRMPLLLGRMPLLLLALLGIAATAPATADPITGASCVNNSCQGGVYTLYYNGNALPDAVTGNPRVCIDAECFRSRTC